MNAKSFKKGRKKSGGRKPGVSQPRLSDLLHGRIEKFFVDALLMLESRAGLVVRLEAPPLTVGFPKLDAPTLTINPGQPRPRAHGTGANTKRNRK